jgi:tetratricopeptide (TPR) repeat protein
MKPDNVILFERPTGGLLAKITDFGFATSALSISGGDDPLHKGELHVRDDIVLTTPSYWSSATRHGEGYTFEAAVLEEVYSFGMTCFWILFYHLTTFPSDAEVEHAKSVGSMSELCLKLARDPELGATDDQIKTLEHLFVITLTHSKEDRATTLAIVDLLEPDVTPSNTIALRNFDVAPLPEGSTMRFIEFHLIAALTQLLAVDYRVRSYIRQSMERIVKEETRPEVLQRTHFELACCYHLGFGGLHDPEERDFHLMKADANISEIEDELRKAMEIKGIVYFGGQFRTSLESGLVPPLDIVQSFRDVPSTSDLPELMKQEVESMERSLGPTSTHIIHMKANLANLLWEHREIQPARTMLRKCLESVDLNPKDVDPWDRVFLAGQVAEAEHRVGNWQEAEKLCHKALENAVQLGDEMTGEIIVLKNQLGLVFADLGRWDEASVIQREIVEYQREYLGANHPITLQMISSLVQTLIELGEYEEAEQHIQQISELRHSVWGPDSQDTLLSLMDEARFLEVQGRIEEAEALERQALSRCRRSLEEDHPYTLDCMMNLANSLINRDQTREAIELAEQCVAAYERVRGERHPDTLRSKTSLALVYNECGRYKDARALDRQVYDQLVHVLGHTHPFTLETMHNLATSHWKLGNPELAEELLLPTVNRRSLLLGEEHRETLQSKNMLAVVYAELDKLPDAIKIAEDILASSRKVLGSSHRETLITATNLASYYYDADDISRAIALEEQTLAEAKACLDPDDSIILTVMQNLASSYMDRSIKRSDEALAMAKEAVAMRMKPDCEDPEGLSNAQSILAQVYDRLEEYDESMKLHKLVLVTRLEIFSEDHPDTVATLEAIHELESKISMSGDTVR